jgi:hypothetical protein
VKFLRTGSRGEVEASRSAGDGLCGDWWFLQKNANRLQAKADILGVKRGNEHGWRFIKMGQGIAGLGTAPDGLGEHV